VWRIARRPQRLPSYAVRFTFTVSTACWRAPLSRCDAVQTPVARRSRGSEGAIFTLATG
jgi:hypothetical protein